MRYIKAFTVLTAAAFLLLIPISANPTALAIENSEVPILPLIIKGDVTLDGEPAEVGTEVTAKINGEVVGTTEVSTKGVYGDLPQNRLLVTSAPENYEKIKFYINGMEAEITENGFNDAKPGATIELDLSASTNQNTNQQNIINNDSLLILLGVLLIIAVIAAAKYKSK